MLFKLQQINHCYQQYQQVLKDVNLDIHEGEMIAIMGPSGSGKTTLLNILCGQLEPTSGEVYFSNTSLFKLDQIQRNSFRKEKIAYIYQDYHLLDSLTNRENIMLGIPETKTESHSIDNEVNALALSLHMKDILDNYPSECSGGQKQRVAIARALSKKPSLLLADEPTGNLDSKQTRFVMEELCRQNEKGLTILIVTHDLYVASFASRLVYLEDGMLKESPEIEKERLNLRERRLSSC